MVIWFKFEPISLDYIDGDGEVPIIQRIFFYNVYISYIPKAIKQFLRLLQFILARLELLIRSL